MKQVHLSKGGDGRWGAVCVPTLRPGVKHGELTKDVKAVTCIPCKAYLARVSRLREKAPAR